MSEKSKLLEIRDLTVHYVTVDGTVHAVEDLSLELEEGKTLGLVGETGAGKTTTVKAVMQILPDPPAKIIQGEISFMGEDLLKKSKKAMRKIRGKQISMIFQDPMTSLNPVYTIGNQLIEMLRLHTTKTKKECWDRAVELLHLVGMNEPEKRMKQYPHEFSGGMRQRVMIAMALACEPKLLIADEPTTALDVTIQAQILELMKKTKEITGNAIILITHDLGVVANMADKVAVMYAGKIVEMTSCMEIFKNPLHPYTIQLLAAKPKFDQKKEERLVPIDGMPPSLLDPPAGCAFAERCKYCTERCRKEQPELKTMENGHQVSCFLV